MSRPIHADAQATQRRILESARRTFADHGLAGGSARQIARDAEVSLAMVHHYFGSKEGLYKACIGAMLDDVSALGAELTAALGVRGTSAPLHPQDAAPSAVIERAVRVGWRFARANRNTVRLLQRSIVDHGEVDVEIRERRMLPFNESLAAHLAAWTGRPATSLRLAVQSSVFLVVRYAIASDRELSDLAFGTGAPRGAEDAAAAVEDNLVESILAMVGLRRGEH